MARSRNQAQLKARDDSPADARTDISDRVLQYFQRHSDATDSVEGIARFWVHEDRSVVEQCLANLHAQGLLNKRTIAGTDFYSLRKELPPPSQPQAAAGPAPHVDAEGRGRLLVVDDDHSVRRFLVETLREEGHSVAAAEDGQRALEMIRTAPFDLVLTDLLMPGISGLEVLQAAKQHDPTIEVIVVTAHASIEAAIKALRFGAYDLITKPLDDLELLYRGVERALEKRRLSGENRLLVDNLQKRNIELKETIARLAAVNEIGRAMTGLLDLNQLFDNLVQLIAQHVKARRVSILLSEPDSDTLNLVASVGLTNPGATDKPIRLGEGIAGRVAASQAPVLVQDIAKSEFKALGGGGRYKTSSFMITPITVSYPIRYQRQRVGVINVSDKHSGDPFSEQDLEFLSTLASQVAVAIENARLVKEMESGYLGAVVSLIRAVEDARPEIRGHSVRVAELASQVAIEMGLPEPRIDLLAQAAALHEIGRVSSRPGKSGRKRDGDAPGEDWTPASVMATERLLAPIASLRAAREIILHSADWFDAAPTPFGADRPGIPVESRILSACEDFARLAPGSGRDSDTTRKALATIRQQAGRKHDPEVVAALCRAVGGGSRK
jgi:response regulator RpfG family c-di-GMP phosphodiesterase